LPTYLRLLKKLDECFDRPQNARHVSANHENTIMKHLLSALCLTFVVSHIVASQSQGHGDSRSGFDLFQQKVEGKWSFFEDKQQYKASFESMSHGKALLERNSGFSVVYYPDGATLMMTLFTKDGPQIRMRAPGMAQNTSSIAFAFQDATNLPPGSGHISGLDIVFKDANHIVERWKMLEANERESSFEFELTRK